MHKVITRHLVKTFDIGVNGNLYGGRLLDWLDESGALYLKETYPHLRFVTYLMGETVFHKPVRQGEMLTFVVTAAVEGAHSVKMNISAMRAEETVLSTVTVFVCVDAQGSKRGIRD
ncbi:MAG: hotdog domain-containing protein [Victivallaceae bacterium]|nr:hotdog domain-containing protein [Victivallaceae bacterium]